MGLMSANLMNVLLLEHASLRSLMVNVLASVLENSMDFLSLVHASLRSLMVNVLASVSENSMDFLSLVHAFLRPLMVNVLVSMWAKLSALQWGLVLASVLLYRAL
jgi:hypothetical protein